MCVCGGEGERGFFFLGGGLGGGGRVGGFVRGSYSAVPRSSFAEVHREFVHHIGEDEVDGQEERQDDRREDREQREESGEAEGKTFFPS